MDSKFKRCNSSRKCLSSFYPSKRQSWRHSPPQNGICNLESLVESFPETLSRKCDVRTRIVKWLTRLKRPKSFVFGYQIIIRKWRQPGKIVSCKCQSGTRMENSDCDHHLLTRKIFMRELNPKKASESTIPVIWPLHHFMFTFSICKIILP